MNNNNLTAEQQQQLKDIGANLNRIRIAKNISLDAVAANTLISKRLLEAIEAGDTKELPEPFYIQALVSKFAQEIGAVEIQFQVDPPEDPRVKHNSPQNNRRPYGLNFQLRSLHLYLLYILLVIVSARGITNLVERPVIINQTPPDSPALNPEAAPETSPEKAQGSQPKTVPQFVSQSSNSEAVSVGIDLQERCWLKVMVDGKLAFEGILPAGTKRNWTGQQEVTIRAGNAGGVVISFNNEQQKILGAPGEVEEITYTVN
ncbi:MAG: helix-turn-helix domain-containing protein [Cyanobacteria bacterium P01_G01_bin.67]